MNTSQNDDIQTTRQQQQSPVNPTEVNWVPHSIPTSQNRFQALNVSPSPSHVTSEEPMHRTGTRTNTSRVTANNSKSGEVAKTRPVVIISDSVIKHIDPKKLSQRPVRKFSYPGKTTDEMAEAVGSSTVATDPSHVIIHTGTNNLPTDSAESCAAKIKSLALKVKDKFPNSRIGISGIIYREDINVDSKRNEIYEMVKLMAEDNNITYTDNSVIDSSGLNGSSSSECKRFITASSGVY